MDLRRIQVSDSLEGVARIGAVVFKRVHNGRTPPALRQRIDDLATELRRSIGDRPLSSLDPVRQTRKLYHAIGIDPTKERPSSERLLREAIKGAPLPEVSSLVDAVHLVALAQQCPLSIYDIDRIDPPVLIRIGRPDDQFIGINGKPVQLEGRFVVVDGQGLFGNPTQDSDRTKTDHRTARALVMAWAPADTSNSKLQDVMNEVVEKVSEFCDGTVGETGIL